MNQSQFLAITCDSLEERLVLVLRLIGRKTGASLLSQSLKPRLHEQFLCGNCMWQFLFARVDGSTNICF